MMNMTSAAGSFSGVRVRDVERISALS